MAAYDIGVNQAGAGSSSTYVSKERTKTELDKNDFLMLLITELRNQDVLNAGDNKDFMQQLAQFASMEQMQNVATGLEKLVSVQAMVHGATLLGKTVEGIAMDDPSQIVSGQVTEVIFSEGDVVLTVENAKVRLADVTSMKTQQGDS